MTTARLNSARLNEFRPNNGSAIYPNIRTEMLRLWDSVPRTQVEFITIGGVVTDISDYYESGASFEQVKDRTLGELQSGDFDIVLFNHDNKFSEYDPTSLLYGIQYHGARIRISQGYVLSSGVVVYERQAVGFIDQIITDGEEAKVTLRCRDKIKRIVDSVINQTPDSEVPVKGTTNYGDGTISSIGVKPFKVKNETWSVVCTLGGQNNVATFSVTGTVSGLIGTATSGVEFSTLESAGGIKFTVTAGFVDWAVGDTFTFTTKQNPEWDAVNAVKIIWSVLTGYNWDTDTQETWSGQALDLDHTKSSSNVDIDYDAFADLVAILDSITGYDLKGYVKRDEPLLDFMARTINLFHGSMFTTRDGLISIKSYAPTFARDDFEHFRDSQKITILGYTRNIEEVVNYVVVNYKKADLWEFSDEEISYNGTFVSSDPASLAKYGQLASGEGVLWYTATGSHVEDMADKIVTRYAEPPLNIDFETGGDGLQTTIGDVIKVTDTKYKFTAITGEVVRTRKDFDSRPIHIGIRMRRDASLDILFGFLATEVDEGDGFSPQASDYDSASEHDKLFGYLGDGLTVPPDYRMF